METSKTHERGQLFYGWYVLAGVVIVTLVSVGSFMNSFGVFLPVICKDFGWSRADVAGFFSLAMLIVGISSPLWGVLISKFGPRINIIIGNGFAALGFAALYFVHGIWQFYLLYIIVGVGCAGVSGFIANATVVNNWFIKKRSLAMGIMTGSSGLAGFIFPLLVTELIALLGWRLSYAVLAGLIAVFSVLIAGLILIRNRPEEKSLSPDGKHTTTVAVKQQPSEKKEAKQSQKIFMQILCKPTIWLIAAAAGANYFAMGLITSHQIAFLQDAGFSPMSAALALSILAAANVIGSLIFGGLGLKTNTRLLAVFAFLLQMIAIFIILVTKKPAFIYVYSVLLGFSFGSISTAIPTILGGIFSRERYAQLLGIVTLIQSVLLSAATYLGGIIFDATSSYTLAFIITLALSAAGFVSLLFLRPVKHVFTD